MTRNIVTEPVRSYDNMDADVYNMSRWGVTFEDANYDFGGASDNRALNYIDFFERLDYEVALAGPEPSPIFWAVWHDYALNDGVDLNRDSLAKLEAIMSQYRLDWFETEPYVPLADWEWELLGWGNHIGWMLIKNQGYSDYIWNILNGE